MNSRHPRALPSISLLSLLLSSLLLSACANGPGAQEMGPFLGSWQGMTYGSGPYDPMFTFTIKPDGVWTDLTFGEAKAVDGKYTYDAGNKALTLITQAGNPLYTFKLEPATASQKERLVEQLPANETYRAMICYHYEP
jgi:hypothetical protein